VKNTFILAVFLAIFLAAAIGFGYFFFDRQATLLALEQKNKELEEAIKNSNDSISRVEEEKTRLLDALNAAAEKNKSFSDQLDIINGTVETYERMRKTDPELLQKYSKVYFLNENYAPSALTAIDTKYLFNKDKNQEIHDRIWPFLRQLMEAATSNGINLNILSAYRSFGTQAALKSSYKVTYGSGANAFSADQGYSEHQLGTAIDFTTPKVGSVLSGFDKDPAYVWLRDNAYKYGFILSYPSGNAYYVFEPWHWRFVSLDLALKLRTERKNFYDLDQRELTTFLANFFNGTTTISQ
jgi:LAS superfamily LD-carboxypeptidase LdcB